MRAGNRSGGIGPAAWVTTGAVVVVLALLSYGSYGRFSPWWHERAMRNAPREVNVLLVTLDTTRADRLGAYGWSQAETPHLDALARQGTLFRQAYSHVPLTAPAHASFLTGLLPTRHGVRDNGTFVLAPNLEVLPERFREAGYRTGAFVSAFVLDRRFGLARGFETYSDDVPGSEAARGGDPSERSVRAEETVQRAIAWLAETDSRPRFLWVHLYDPHAPYEPPEPFATRHRERPYDGEIAYMDAQLGRLFTAVDALAPRWLKVVVGDHGEGLGDHDEVTHGYYVYGNTQRVPLVVSLPGDVPRGREIESVVRGVDVAPTILDLCGLPALPDADGRSLIRLIAGRRDAAPGPAYLESFHPRFWWGAQELLALRTDQWLLIDSPRPELYDVRADPAERNNLAGSRPRELESLGRQLRQYTRPGSATAGQVRLDPEAEARLRTLGYVGSAAIGSKPGSSGLPDAKDNGPLLAAVTQAQELAIQGRHAEALAKFREALEKNPRAASVRKSIADTLLILGRTEEAFSEFAELVAIGFGDDTAYLGMSKARMAQGDVDAALAVTRYGLQSTPDSVALLVHEGELLLRLNKLQEAEQAFRKALAVVPRDQAAQWGLGLALSRQARKQESVEVMLRLAEESPRSTQGRASAEALEVWADERLAAGAPKDARRGYNAALSTGRASPPLFLNLALASWQLGLQPDALNILRQGVNRFPDSPELIYREARLLQQLGRAAEAEAGFRRVLELAPGHASATAALTGK